MRHLLLLLLLLLTPVVEAQEPGPIHMPGHANAGEQPALAPGPLPELIVGKLETPRFLIRYTTKSQGAARELAKSIESTRDAFAGVLGRDWPGVTEIRVGLGRQEFEALALPGGKPPGWAVALAYPAHRIVLLDALTMTGPEGPVTLRHELAHVALGQLGSTWPRWFQEGLAQHLTGENYSMTHYAALFRAVAQERVFHFEHLADRWPDLPSDVEIAYAQSAAFVAWLSARYGPEGMGQLVDEVGTGEPFERAFGKAFHSSVLVEELVWRQGLAARYGWLPLTTSTALMWLGATALVVAAYVRRRRQKEARLAEMAAQEAAEDEAMRATFEEELTAWQEEEASSPTSPEDATAPEWYELHSARNPELEEDDEPPPRPPKPTLH